jgi:hypothetical protein
MNFAKNQFDTTKPFINQSIITGTNAPISSLYDYQYSFAVGAFLDNGEIIPPDKIFKYGTPIMLVMVMDIEKVETGILNFILKQTWGVKPCNDIKDTTLIADMLDPEKTPLNILNYVKNNMMCLDFTNKEDLFVEADMAQPPFRMQDFRIFPCMLANTADCATAEELKRVTWKLALGRKITNTSNKKSPVNFSIHFEHYQTNI